MIRRSPVITSLCILALTLVVMKANAAGFWSNLGALFSSPRVEAPYAEAIAAESSAYLEFKSDSIQAAGQLSEQILLDLPRQMTGPNGESLVEVRSFVEAPVTAAVDFTSEDYSYSAGDALLMRIYSATLFELAADGSVVRHLYKPLALRNMSNPRSRDEEVELLASLAEAESFTPDETGKWLATDVTRGERLTFDYGETE